MAKSSIGIFTPVPLVIRNSDFQDNPSTLPPPGWQIGGPATGSACTLSYDTTTPYTGTVSLIITATTAFSGILSTETYQVVPGEIYQVQCAIKSLSGDIASIQFIYFDAGGNYIPGPVAGNAGLNWTVVGSRFNGLGLSVVPPGAVTGIVQLVLAGPSGGIAEFDSVSVIRLSAAIPYYRSLFTSQWQNSPNLLALAEVLLLPFVDVAVCAAGLYTNFDLSLAQSRQLDSLGAILGISRLLPFQPTGGLSTTLNDSDFTILLRAKIAQNQWNGQIGSLWTIWQTLFPGGSIYVTDNQNMTATIILAGSFTPVMKQMISNGMIVPRPEAVQYTFTFATLPIFGFDGVDPTIVAGFDLGHFA